MNPSWHGVGATVEVSPANLGADVNFGVKAIAEHYAEAISSLDDYSGLNPANHS